MPPLSSQRTSVEPGTIIAGKYEIEEQIGKGGMGVIVAARHMQLEERVALKFLMAPEGRAEEFQARFLREARVTAKLRGAHVARTLDYGVTDEGDPYIVMELLEGINLRQFLRDAGPLPLEIAVNYALQACEGLAEAHRLDVVHRDLKPANLFLTTHLDGADLLKILDFGVSKLRNLATSQSDLTEAGTIIGSPRYMAVEQLMQAGDVDTRADVWSLGAIIYEMLAGRPLFAGCDTSALCMAIIGGTEPEPLSELRPELPPALDDVVKGCMARDLSKRIPDVATLARELVRACGIPGLEPAAQAVADVLYQQLLTTTAGNTRPFPQATGVNPAASGRFRILGAPDSSGEGTRTFAEVTVLETPGARAVASGRYSKPLRAAAGGALAVVAAAAAFYFASPPDAPPATPSAASQSTSPPLAAAPPPAEPTPGTQTAQDASAADAAPSASADADIEGAKPANPTRVARPPIAPPPTRARPPSTGPAATPTVRKKRDVFSSRY